jgi:uncharacterized protein YeaO (DUF488 family)
MSIRLKRWNDPRSPSDGYRVLVCRYRPRALPKSRETWDMWIADAGPSRELHADYYGKHGPPIGMAEYKRRYLAEMGSRPDVVEKLAALAAQGTISLLCSSRCEDPALCHRTLLKALVEDELKRVRGLTRRRRLQLSSAIASGRASARRTSDSGV